MRMLIEEEGTVQRRPRRRPASVRAPRVGMSGKSEEASNFADCRAASISVRTHASHLRGSDVSTSRCRHGANPGTCRVRGRLFELVYSVSRKRVMTHKSCGSSHAAKNADAIFRDDHLCRQHFALGHQVLDREDELVVTLPGLLRQESAAGSEVLECGVVCGRLTSRACRRSDSGLRLARALRPRR